MNFKYFYTLPGKGKLTISGSGAFILLIGLFSHYDSHWKKLNEMKINQAQLSEWGSEGKDVPAYSMEQYFIYMIIICFVLSLISLVASVLIDTTKGKKKLVDFGYHILAGVLLLIAGIVYISSSKRIEKLALFWKDGSEMKLRLGVKNFAGALVIIQSLLYTVEAIFISTADTSLQHPVSG